MDDENCTHKLIGKFKLKYYFAFENNGRKIANIK